MGTYVPNVTDPPFEWGDKEYIGTDGELTKALVISKFDSSVDVAQNLLDLLVGEDWKGGYLGELNDQITSFSVPDITVDDPDELVWFEQAYSSEIFTALLTRLLTDLQTGATGLDPTVEQDIYDRALARQAIEDARVQSEIEDYFAARGFELPTGAMAGRLAEQANEISRNNTDLNGKIAEDQAKLAQANSQYIITVSKDVEAILRDFSSRKNDRSLDYAKAKTVAYDLQLRAAIANAGNQLQAYIAESSLREKIAADMTNAVMQGVASANGMVNMSASLSHGTGRSQSESFGHSETRSIGYSKGEAIGESHSFAHDPA